MRLHLTADPGSQERIGYASDARAGLEVLDILELHVEINIK